MVDIGAEVFKTQIGYRSPSVSDIEKISISGDKRGRTKTDVVTDLVTDYEFSQHQPRAFVVNDRDYSERVYPYISGEYTTWSGSYDNQDTSTWYIAPISHSSSVYSGLPSEGTMQNMAASLMRQSVPAQSEINLLRIAAEQREFGLLLRASNYRPRSVSEAAGAYLNYVFGVKPTISDLKSVSEAVLVWDTHIRRYIRAERHRLRRKRSVDLGTKTQSGTFIGRPGSGFDVIQGFGGVTVKYGMLYPSFYRQANYPFNVTLRWACTSTQRLSQFATFEYFVPRPADLLSRLSRYRQLAESVVGGGLDVPTAYELTRWSWLVDWFVDIGGLLRYQQTVSDNQIVATASGYSVFQDFLWQLTYCDLYPVVSTEKAGVVSFSPQTVTATARTHVRRPGNPYSIGPTWDLSQQQWAILGALGLARSSNVPIKR